MLTAKAYDKLFVTFTNEKDLTINTRDHHSLVPQY